MNTLQMMKVSKQVGFEEEAPSNPWGHRVCLWRPEVNVQHDHGHADAGDNNCDCNQQLDQPERIEDHGEEDKLAEEGDDEGGGWDDLGQEEEEHGQGEQDGDGQGDLVIK